jgi:hypothetical protein
MNLSDSLENAHLSYTLNTNITVVKAEKIF